MNMRHDIWAHIIFFLRIIFVWRTVFCRLIFLCWEVMFHFYMHFFCSFFILADLSTNATFSRFILWTLNKNGNNNEHLMPLYRIVYTNWVTFTICLLNAIHHIRKCQTHIYTHMAYCLFIHNIYCGIPTESNTIYPLEKHVYIKSLSLTMTTAMIIITAATTNNKRPNQYNFISVLNSTKVKWWWLKHKKVFKRIKQQHYKLQLVVVQRMLSQHIQCHTKKYAVDLYFSVHMMRKNCLENILL